MHGLQCAEYGCNGEILALTFGVCLRDEAKFDSNWTDLAADSPT